MICPHCDTSLENGALFCYHCGARFDQVSPVQTPPNAYTPPQNAYVPPQNGYNAAPNGNGGYAQGYRPPYAAPPYAQPHQAPNGYPMDQPPNNFLTGNIVLTVLSLVSCCSIGPIGLVFAIIGLINAADVNTLWRVGNRARAEQKAKLAKTMFYISLAFLILSVVLWIILPISGFYASLLGRL